MSQITPPLDVSALRAGFPSLSADRVYLDNPGGTQAHRTAIDAMTGYLQESNANLGGPFATSVASDRMLGGARGDLAALLGATPERSPSAPT